MSAAALLAQVVSHPRVRFAPLPTPFHFAPNLTKALGGPRIYFKRDDLTGLGLGGNKTRKLEFLCGDAMAHRATCLVTGAGVQSNHCRQTAAAAAQLGLRCVLFLNQIKGPPAQPLQGNLLLDGLFGAELRLTRQPSQSAVIALMHAEAERLTAAGERPYVLIPSTPIGTLGYVLAASEFATQCAEAQFQPDRLWLASAGGTQAGLLLGSNLLGAGWRVTGVAPMEGVPELKAKVAQLASQTASLLAHTEAFDPGEVELLGDYVGPAGYGFPSEAGLEAVQLVARTEGILLDPVYTGKAMAGLIDHIRQGAFAAHHSVVFWHTGGAPALFAHAGEVGTSLARMRTPDVYGQGE